MAHSEWSDLERAVEAIRDRVSLIRGDATCAEFVVRGAWVEIQAQAVGYLVRIYAGGVIRERCCETANDAIDVARVLVREALGRRAGEA